MTERETGSRGAGRTARGVIRSAVRSALAATALAMCAAYAAPAHADGLQVIMITDLGSGWSLAAAFGNPASPCFQTSIYSNMPTIDLGPASTACSALGASAPVNVYIKGANSPSWTDCGSFRWLRAHNAANPATLYADRVDGATRCQVQEPAF